MHRSGLLLALLALAAGQARADGAGARTNELSDEMGVSSSAPTPTSRRSTQTSNLLEAAFDLGAGVSLDLSLGSVAVNPTQAVPRQEFATKGDTVWTLGAGLSWEADDHWTFEASGHLSPVATLRADSTVDYTASPTSGTVALDALLVSRSSSAGATLAASYDTAGDSDAESAVDVAAGLEHYATDQRIPALRDPRSGAVITRAQLVDACRISPTRCPKALLGVLRETPAALDQVSLQAGFTETLWRDTDLGLSATGYVYDRDPADVGYFGLATAGKSAAAGAGIPTAPLRWSLRPSVAQRLGDWTLRLAYQHGAYVSGEGTLDALTAKVQYRFSGAFRMWIVAAGQRDEDGQGNVNVLRSLALGALYRW